MNVTSLPVRFVGKVVPGCALAAVLLGGCADSATVAPGAAGSGSPTAGTSGSSAVVSAVPVAQEQQVFADQRGGVLDPLPSGTHLALSAEQVRQKLSSRPEAYLSDPAVLTVRVGLFRQLVAASAGPTAADSTAAPSAGVAVYVFSGGSGACPPAGRGGGDGPATVGPTGTCHSVVVADASTGELVQEETS